MTLRNSVIALVASLTVLAVAGSAGLAVLARFLEAQEPLQPADYIVVFAGDFTARPVHAARLFRQGFAPEVVTTGAFVPDEVCALGLRVTGAELSARVLERNGVPRDRIRVLASGHSTLEEARAFADFARDRELASAIVVTSPYHVRRARLILGRVLESRGVKVMGSAAGVASSSRWWSSKAGLLHLNNELLKLAFYELPAPLRQRILEPGARAGADFSGEDRCPPL